MKSVITKKKHKWKRYFRDDKGIWEDVCEHGIGHDKGTHGCDGCCSEIFITYKGKNIL